MLTNSGSNKLDFRIVSVKIDKISDVEACSLPYYKQLTPKTQAFREERHIKQRRLPATSNLHFIKKN